MKINLSQFVLAVFVMVLVLLPFSRVAELPILILTIMGIIGGLKHRKYLHTKPKFILLSWVYFCYLGMILFSASDSYWQNKTLIVALSSLRFYFSALALVLYMKPQQQQHVLNLVAGLTVIWSFDAMVQYIFGVNLLGLSSYAGRLNGVFGQDHAKLGPVLALFLPSVMIALKNQHQLSRWLVTLMVIITIILSGTRSAWIMMLFVLIAYWLHHVKHRRYILLLKSVLVSLILVVGLWFIAPDFHQRVERSFTAFDGSVAGLDFALADRLPIWYAALAMIQQHPINGVGAHAFRNAYAEFTTDEDIWQKNGGVGMHAHHWLLEILAETGIIGLLLFALAVFKLIQFAKRNDNNEVSWVFLIALISAFLPITSIYSIFASFWSICLWFCGTAFILTSQQHD